MPKTEFKGLNFIFAISSEFDPDERAYFKELASKSHKAFKTEFWDINDVKKFIEQEEQFSVLDGLKEYFG
jgi:hypothetical protein